MNQQFDISAATEASSRSTGHEPKLNRQVVLASRPQGLPQEMDFGFQVAAAPPPPKRGEVLLRALYLSMDPYLRGKLREIPTFGPRFEINQPLQSAGIAEVVESKSPQLKTGDTVVGLVDWADYSVRPAKSLRLLEPKAAPLTAALGVLGMTGLTAYFGMMEIAQPEKGETAVISAAAGAVGSVAGQIAKLCGCRVIGITSSNPKARFLRDELGFDAVINYKTSDVARGLQQACPEGVDIYYDNVGGPITDAVVMRIKNDARIVVCGQISTYNTPQQDTGPRPYGLLLAHSAMMQGFSVYDYEKQHTTGLRQLTKWLKEGKLKNRENIIEGLQNAPKAFIGLFKGENIGKQIVQVNS